MVKIITYITFLLFFIISNICYASEADNNQEYPVLLLKSEHNCASAFFTNDNKIITAAHVVNSCIKDDCNNFEIFYKDKKVTYSSLKLSKISYAFDIVLLDIENPSFHLNGIDISKEGKINVGSNIKIIGFPKCKEVNIDNSNILQINNLFFSTNSKSNFGNSGSLVINDDNDFVGVATKATNVSSAIKSLITGESLHANVINAKVLNEFIKLNDEEILPYEISNLLTFYNKNIYSNFTPTRYPTTFNFMIMVNNILSHLPLYKTIPNNYITEILSSNFNAPYILSNISYERGLKKEEESAEKLAMLYSFEKKGFYNIDFKMLDINSLKSSLDIKERSKEHKKDLWKIIDNAKVSTKYSYAISYIVTRTWFILALVIFLFFAIFSSGVYFNKFSGTSSKRILKTIIFLLTWPISHIICKLRNRKTK